MKRLVFLVGVGIALALAPPASAACTQTKKCSVDLRAKADVSRWTSPQAFPRNGALMIRARVKGRRLRSQIKGLTADYFGRGVALRIRAQRHRAPFRARYVSLGKPRTIRLVYWIA